ncbi:MAG: Gfo/Idh/MocA family oxidoreductase [Pirellulales bacterium]|nr:Gfo/Idh/MocA family oxidoreductase [Pirellulales bacterium]
MYKFSRRQFLQTSALAAAAATSGSAGGLFAAENSSSSAPKGGNEKLSFCVVGVRGQGTGHIGNLLKLRDDADIVAICDVDQKYGNLRCDEVERATGKRPKYYQDIRKMLENKGIDCVSMAIPNHWHALASIWAMQAGKDVYIEKPVSHNVSEGRRMVETARKYNRICQTGTQCRTMKANRDAMDFIHKGGIGEVKVARGFCYKPRNSIGPVGQYDIPNHLDYNIWCGPAPARKTSPYKGIEALGWAPHYDWHWRWETGNGDLGNQGIHQMDLCRWALGVDTLAHGVVSYGGRFGYTDAGTTPNTQVIVLDYGPKTLVFEVRGLKTEGYKEAGGVGIYVEGTDGYFVTTGYTTGEAVLKDGSKKEFAGGRYEEHHANFIKAVRTRKKEDLNADILDGHLSSALCHLGNISYRLGQPMATAGALDRLKAAKLGDLAQDTLDRTIEHLLQNNVKLDGDSPFQCGEFLTFDPRTETFPGNAKATELCTREYRKGFEVPAAGKV